MLKLNNIKRRIKQRLKIEFDTDGFTCSGGGAVHGTCTCINDV